MAPADKKRKDSTEMLVENKAKNRKIESDEKCHSKTLKPSLLKLPVLQSKVQRYIRNNMGYWTPNENLTAVVVRQVQPTSKQEWTVWQYTPSKNHPFCCSFETKKADLSSLFITRRDDQLFLNPGTPNASPDTKNILPGDQSIFEDVRPPESTTGEHEFHLYNSGDQKCIGTETESRRLVMALSGEQPCSWSMEQVQSNYPSDQSEEVDQVKQNQKK